ncbi:uncharacterized mitochondrial protein AtMg00860-like [Aristolochia californica]|uniref:uncharacterized mitochondrial protein AtMg00860-like n=1 Tax=Aristolochia californica TaxID=171875 RepID=UPI0035E19F30
MANGGKLPSYGINKAVLFTIQGRLFEAEFFIILLAGFDMVLGIKWLQTLGPILWDFAALTMNFEMAGHKSWPQHLEHINMVFQLIHAHRLYLKRTKCTFGQQQVAYLGNIITASGVTVDPKKITAVTQWPPPQNVSALRGFLGLSGYYKKFISNYAALATPLSNLLRHNAFVWNMETDTAFHTLKIALAIVPVLQLPNFEELFVVECDASGGGIGTILQQSNHPIAYFSRQFAIHQHKLPVYERELIGSAKAVHH